MSPIRRFFLRNLTIVFPSLDYLWDGETLRSEFSHAGHKIEIHQWAGSAGPYHLKIDGKILETPFEHIGAATNAAFRWIQSKQD
jgi:hypothetical protein